MASPAAPAVEPEELLIWRSRSPFCVQSLDNDLLFPHPALASCPQQGRKRADSRESKGSPEAKGPGRHNWKRPKYLEAIFDLRRRHSKVFNEVQIATSSCTEESAAITAAVGSTFTDLGKQPITDVSITSSPSLFYPSSELAEQRDEAEGEGKNPADREGAGEDNVEDPEEVMGEPESRRCQRTDGKKWRCWRSTTPNEKYCERHMHLGRKRPVQVDFGKNPELESGRCQRTDGKKWCCSRRTTPNEKYCERHMHFGRKHPVQVDFGKKPEPKSGRCRRTDGKKWQCSRSTIPNEKYCERHIHLSRKRHARLV